MSDLYISRTGAELAAKVRLGVGRYGIRYVRRINRDTRMVECGFMFYPV